MPVCQTFETLPSQDANYDEILRAYTQLEAQGICHGDVHGANVLKTDNGVEIIDFGFCLQIGNFPITRWPWVLKPSAAAIYKKYCYMSLEISKKKLGDDHPSIATSYGCIGVVYDSQGKYDDALKYYLMGLEIYKKKLEDDHPDVAA